MVFSWILLEGVNIHEFVAAHLQSYNSTQTLQGNFEYSIIKLFVKLAFQGIISKHITATQFLSTLMTPLRWATTNYCILITHHWSIATSNIPSNKRQKFKWYYCLPLSLLYFFLLWLIILRNKQKRSGIVFCISVTI